MRRVPLETHAIPHNPICGKKLRPGDSSDEAEQVNHKDTLAEIMRFLGSDVEIKPIVVTLQLQAIGTVGPGFFISGKKGNTNTQGHLGGALAARRASS